MQVSVRHQPCSKHFMFITNLFYLYNNHTIQVQVRTQEHWDSKLTLSVAPAILLMQGRARILTQALWPQISASSCGSAVSWPLHVFVHVSVISPFSFSLRLKTHKSENVFILWLCTESTQFSGWWYPLEMATLLMRHLILRSKTSLRS